MSGKRRIGLVGGGVIGAGWAARLLLNGHDAVVFDPDPEIGRKLGEVLGNARRAQAKLFSSLAPPEGRLTVAASLAEAVAEADLVIESLPEVEPLKVRVLAEIDAVARPAAIVASSTSGLLPTKLQAGMRHPERFVVGHPFNPVYLLPLVEICGGAKTAPAAKSEAASFFESLGMRPLDVRHEVDGFIADRLLEALWREALWLVDGGIATTQEIDDAIRFGAGLRWSFMGTFMTYRIAGGEAGMRHFLAQFGPALKLPWTRLEAPELTDALVEAVSTQSDDQAAGVSIRDLERKRDDCLVAVLGGLRAQDFGAGQVIKAHERRLMEELATKPSASDPDVAAPLHLYEARVGADWIDYNGHMTEYRYLQAFAEATDALLRRVGAGADYVRAGRSFYTVETHLLHRGQAKLDERIGVETQVLAQDPKRLHLFHRLVRRPDGATLATAEQMLLHVDATADRAVPAEGPVLAALERLGRTHAGLPRPPETGRQVGLRRG